jgi:hypothetical protein
VKHSADDGLSLSYGESSGSPTTRAQLGSARAGGYLQSAGACVELLSRNSSLQVTLKRVNAILSRQQ